MGLVCDESSALIGSPPLRLEFRLRIALSCNPNNKKTAYLMRFFGLFLFAQS